LYNNTYIYFPNDKNEIIFYQNVVGNTIRNGLTIYSVPKKLQTKNNKSRFVHLSLQPNTFYRIIKRGMPKLYEYNLNPKNRSKSSSLFNELLLNNLKQYYEAVRIPRINIKQIKIKSKIIFQISFDKENNGWIVNDNFYNCVIFRDINEIEALYLDNKITKNMYQICKECDELFRNILKKKESQNTNINHNFLHEISENTFLGYYLEEKEEVVFYSIVSNLQYNREQFCLPIKTVEDICFKFGLPYEKSIVLKTDLVTFEQIEHELKYVYRRISEDYSSFQSYGGIVLIEHDTEIITGFKILNQEMEIIKRLRYIKYNSNFQDVTNRNNTIKEEDEFENENAKNNTDKDHNLIDDGKLNALMYELSLYQLPRCVHIYCKVFNDLTEEDSINKCLDNLEETSKNINQLGLCNCIKEKNKKNTTSINLLSCLIPKDNLDDYNIERIGENNNIIIQVPQDDKVKTIIFDKTNNLTLNYQSRKSLFLDPKQTIINKKNKKRVKYVDEVYNKSLVEEIPIKSFKLYNVKNNFTYGEDSNNYRTDKKMSCCIII
jgi:hypothetical protein